MSALSLYVHIPFCRAKCAYCDFASYPRREADGERYFCALGDELASWQPELAEREIKTVFLGGGTPSLMPEAAIARLMAQIRACGRVSPDAEITMEANPGTLTARKLRVCREAGINRLSLGAQAMDDRLLRALGRIHTAGDVRASVAMARAAGFDDVSLDLMYALPGQSRADWLRTLDAAVALEPEHISAYSLIVEEGTPMADWVSAGRVSLPDEDEAVGMQRDAIERLARAGYARYEISNFARPGRECRHNLVYWLRGDYLGIGCAAHSLMDGVRFENPRGLDEYLAGERRVHAHRLSRVEEMEETLMLSTRLTRGMDLAAYGAEFGVDFVKAHRVALGRLAALGLVCVEDGFLRLTLEGMEVQNAVVVELLDE